MKTIVISVLGCALLGASQDDAAPAGVRILGSAIFQAPSDLSSIAFSPDSRRLAAGTGSHGIVVWDLETRREVDRIPADGIVTALQYFSDGRRLVFMTMKNQGSEDGTVIWDLQTRKELLRFRTPNYYGSFGLSPDERILLTGERGPGHQDLPGVLAWDTAEGKPLPGLEEVARQQKDVRYRVAGMSFNADGTKVACVDSWSGASNNAKFDRRQRMSIWDWKTAKLLHEWIDAADLLGWRCAVRWLPGDAQLLVATHKQTHVVNASDGTVVRKFNGFGVASPSLSQVHCHADGRLVTYDLATGEKKDSFAVPVLKYPAQGLVSRDGRWFAVSGNNQTPALFDLKNREAVAPRPEGHLRQPYGVGYSADGRLMVFDGGATRVYDDATGRVLTKFKTGFYYMAGIESRSSDGRLLMAKGDSGGRAELWDTARGELLGKLKSGSGGGGVQSTWMSPDGAWAATQREYSGTLQFHDLKTGEPMGKLVGPQHSFFGRSLHVTGCAWNAAGDKVFLGCNNSPWFHGQKPKAPGIPDMMNFTGAFDPRTGTLIYLFETPSEKVIEGAEGLDYHPPQDLVFAGGGGFFGLWKGADGKFVREVERPGSQARFTPDGKCLVSPDGVVEVGTGKLARSFDVGKVRVLSPSGDLLAAFHEDQILLVLDVHTGKELARRDLGAARLAGKIQVVSWHPGESQIAVVLENQPAVLQVDLPELAKRNPAAEVRVRELRERINKAEPMKVEWK